MQNINEIKDQICDVCHKMWQLGWVAANDGNVSVRLEDGRILATPTGMSKSFITPEKLVLLDPEGNVLEAAEGLRPSSEIKMHLRCYDKRDDVMSVIHAHPPGATGLPWHTMAHGYVQYDRRCGRHRCRTADALRYPFHRGSAQRD